MPRWMLSRRSQQGRTKLSSKSFGAFWRWPVPAARERELAATIIFAGFKRVIGNYVVRRLCWLLFVLLLSVLVVRSMNNIDDRSVAQKVYEELFLRNRST